MRRTPVPTPMPGWSGIPLFGGSLFGSYQDRDGDSTTAGSCCTPTTVLESRSDRLRYGHGTRTRCRAGPTYINYSDSDEDQQSRKSRSNLARKVDRKQYTMGIRHLF